MTVTESVPDIDLRWVEVEAKLNAMFVNRGVNTRIRCEAVNEYVMKVTLRDYILAVYLRDTNELMRGGGCLDLHWGGICRAFTGSYKGLTILK